MKAGEFPDGAHVLRAKIDMAHPNMIMRDPLLLRIRHAQHYRQGDAWCLYPLYDFAHPLSDAIEGITHSLCTLEFKDNNDIYEWLVRECGLRASARADGVRASRARLHGAEQAEAAAARERRLVAGWDDPRMPTVAGLRRRGVTPEGLRDVRRGGRACRASRSAPSSRRSSTPIRDDLNMRVPRVMCVVNPLKVVLTNYPEGSGRASSRRRTTRTTCRSTGSRMVPFSRELYIERDDFMEDPPKKFFRLASGPRSAAALRLFHHVHGRREGRRRATSSSCAARTIPATRGGDAPDGRKVQGTIHWVSAPARARLSRLRLYDKLFSVPDPDDVDEGQDFSASLNPDSLVVVTRREDRAECGEGSDRHRGISSSGPATSSATRSTRSRARSCSIAR